MDRMEMVVLDRKAVMPVHGFDNELFDRWTAYIDAKEKTVESYKRSIKQFRYYVEVNGITHPTREDVISFRDTLMKNHKATTVQSYIMAVKQFFRWADQEGLYPNIADHVKGAKIETGFKKDYLTSKQVGKLLSKVDCTTLKGLRDYAIIALMVTTGMMDIYWVLVPTLLAKNPPAMQENSVQFLG